jgi:hypothetical protein
MAHAKKKADGQKGKGGRQSRMPKSAGERETLRWRRSSVKPASA